ncbi:ankyrin repeat-containing protein BDA1-like isoform X2 [Mercurialis annua]|uniref:ankyrin repeat-containing protein BDA1-like isoform X2 n=1 Tax=Mercurialis annua TaxID=3986 RepID=UPI00215F1B65|nr:ankyrin repeat-containing protein BDA1-like isoform X2 [Mercurialis annua]
MESQHLSMLYAAATKGCIQTLNSLIQTDQLILHKISLSSFAETPLHVSSLLGHLDFTLAILEKCPGMAAKLDSLQRYPLHLASAEGNTDIVKALLSVNKNVCLSCDEEGRMPLHLAAMRGSLEAIRELVRSCPESIFHELLDDEDTVLHLCVKYNQLDALKLLVEMVNDDEFISKANRDGNTVLHLAAMLKRFKMIKYLISLSKVKKNVNSMNRMGLTALDLLEQCFRDFRSLEIRDILRETGAKRAVELNHNLLIPTTALTVSGQTSSKRKSWFQKCMKYIQYDLEETRGALMIVATVIATMTFQAAMNPPGGIWQQTYTNSGGSPVCSETNICQAGTSVLAYTYPNDYTNFQLWNGIAFFASLCVVALVVGGFPLTNKLCVWLLAQAIGITLIFHAQSYVMGIILVTPSRLRSEVEKADVIMFRILLGVTFCACIIEFLRFFVWTAKRVRQGSTICVWR